MHNFDRDLDGFIVLKRRKKVDSTSFGKFKLIKSESSANPYNPSGLSREKHYDVSHKSKSWVKKAWDSTCQVPMCTDKSFRQASSPRLAKVLKVIIKFVIKIKYLETNHIAYTKRYPDNGYAAVNTLQDFEKMVKLLHYEMWQAYAYGIKNKTKDNNSRIECCIKAITVYDDLSYDTFVGEPLVFYSNYGVILSNNNKFIKVATRRKK